MGVVWLCAGSYCSARMPSGAVIIVEALKDWARVFEAKELAKELRASNDPRLQQIALALDACGPVIRREQREGECYLLYADQELGEQDIDVSTGVSRAEV